MYSPANSAVSGSVLPTRSTARRLPARLAAARSRAVFLSRATTRFTYKVFTLDLRYSDTNLSKGDCNAFTSDYTARFDGSFTPINPGGFGSNWCAAAGIAKLSADLTAMTNLK